MKLLDLLVRMLAVVALKPDGKPPPLLGLLVICTSEVNHILLEGMAREGCIAALHITDHLPWMCTSVRYGL
jgi:hypothetical protein